MIDVSKYKQLITSEHSSRPKFSDMVGVSVAPNVDLQNSYSLTPFLYDLDSAVGAQLDAVGQWVGISRQLRTALTGVYFELDTVGVGFDAGVWLGPYDPVTGLTALPDEFYRLAIRARVLNNSWDGSKQALYDLTSIIFGSAGYTFYVEDYANLTIGIGLLGPTTPPPILVAMLNNGLLDVKPVTIQIVNRLAQQGPIFSMDLDTLLFKGFDVSYWGVSA